MTAGGRDFDGAMPETVTGLLAASELRRGDFIAGRYRIGSLLGMGGMGVVYQARDEQLGIDVALKLLRPELAARPEAFERFRRELLLARQVSSPHVVRIHDLVKHGDIWLLSMDYVAGRSLQQVIDEDGQLPPARALQLTRQMALGLAAAHHRGVVHRDLKPANVLVTADDEAMITDFGVARSIGATGVTLSGVIVGTPEYLSPEQARADPVDARSDLYALGLILHEMLSGKLPFSGGTPAEMLAQRIVRSPPSVSTVRPDLPAFVVRLCDRLLDVRPARRLQDATAVVAAIDQQQLPRQSATDRPWPVLVMVLAGIALLAAIFVGRDWRDPAAHLPVTAAPSQPPAELVVLAGTPPPDADASALFEGVQREVAMRLQQAGVGLIDPLRVARARIELGIARGSSDSGRERLLAALGARRVLTIDWVDEAPPAVHFTLATVGRTDGEWQRRVAIAEPSSLDARLDALWTALADRLQAGPLPTPFSEADELRRLADLDLQDSRAIDPAAFPAAASTDRWWWALETLDRDGRSADAQRLARDALRALSGEGSVGARRVTALATYLSGDPDAALRLLDAMPTPLHDHPMRLLRARVLLASGAYADAAAIARAVVDADPRNVDGWFLLGKALLLTGDAQSAVDDALTRALVSANRLDDHRMQADVINAMGIGYRQLGQLQPAADHFERAAQLRGALQDARGQGASLRNLAAVRSIQGRFDDADRALEQARELIQPLGDPASMADLVNDVGLVAEERGDFRVALDAYREALGFRQTVGDPGWIAESLLNVGFAYYHVGEFDNAQVFLQQAAQAYGEIDDQAGAIRADQGLALSELARGNLPSARGLFEASLEASERLQMREEHSTALAALAEIDRLQGNYPKALAQARDALALFAGRGDQRGVAELRLLVAAILLDQGELADAADSLSALDAEALESVEQQAMLQASLARQAMLQGRSVEAVRHAAQAVGIAEAAGAAATEIHARLWHARALAAGGDAVAARKALALAESGLNRFASVPIKLDVLETRLAVRVEPLTAYRDARTLIARLPAYGREWQIAALAMSAGLPEAERSEAGQRLHRSVERQVADWPAEPAARFRHWVESRAAELEAKQ